MSDKKDKNLIPYGYYCYDENGRCPYWCIDDNRPEQENGYCSYLDIGDWEMEFGLLWDQCKECGIKILRPEDTLYA